MSAGLKCDHPACSCEEASLERDGRRFCSEHCASHASTQATGGCNCAHSGCAGRTRR